MSRLKLTQVRKTVTTSGVPVLLSGTPLKTASVLIIADPDNSGTIYIGDSDVDAATKLGVPIAAGDDLELEPAQYLGTYEFLDLNLMYVDSSNSGDSIIISYYEREVD